MSPYNIFLSCMLSVKAQADRLHLAMSDSVMKEQVSVPSGSKHSQVIALAPRSKGLAGRTHAPPVVTLW